MLVCIHIFWTFVMNLIDFIKDSFGYGICACHHGLRSYNSLIFLCTALCSKNLRASKGLAANTQQYYYASGVFPCYFGFRGLKRKGAMTLQSY